MNTSRRLTFFFGFLLILGRVSILIGERVSYVDDQGVLVDNLFLLLGGAFMMGIGTLGISSIMLFWLVSWLTAHFRSS